MPVREGGCLVCSDEAPIRDHGSAPVASRSGFGPEAASEDALAGEPGHLVGGVGESTRGQLGENLRKWDFILRWTLLESGRNAKTGCLSKSCLKGGDRQHKDKP